MTVFLIGAVLLTAIALAFVLPPLLRKEEPDMQKVRRDDLNLAVLRDQLRELDADLREGMIDQAAYESARLELERRVAEEVQPAAAMPKNGRSNRGVAIAVGVAVPLLAMTIYLAVGSPAALDPKQRIAADENAHEVTAEQMEGLVAGLAERLRNQPDDVNGWNILARSYASMGRYPEASKAYAHLVTLVPNDANLLVDYADMLAMTLGKSLQGEPEKIVERALQVDPKNIKALSLAGSAAFERRDYANAITHWRKILALVPADSETAKTIAGSINEAQSLSGRPIAAQPPVAQAAQAGVVSAAAAPSVKAAGWVQGTVELDPALRGQVADTDVLFIFARAVNGPQFPLAVLRKQVKDLPVSFSLDDSMSMMPDVKLSSFPQVVVGARISKSGNATPDPNDFEGLTGAVVPRTGNLKIIIKKRRE
ncbi:MAG: c-type cytochrome biogenesis protein CcmI [Burkholderiales bacterium RIFCSPLOWO2_02_FULL_57_36]|nr:MAG: c-type cytochrome biogenesis protein CcmI [Burkholderiales bacterium RIFCSPLOWO2_02_FULL_57_36]